MSDLTSPVIWVNGERGGAVSPLDRGFAYGDGLFETCRVQAGCVPLLDWHFKRLQAGLGRLAIELDGERLASDTRRAVADVSGDGVLKILVTRGSGGRGYAPPDDALATVVVIFYPGAPALDSGEPALRLTVCPTPLSRNAALAGLKHLNRLENVMACQYWQRCGFDEGLLLDERGFLVEATAHNVLVYRGGQWWTPGLESAGVEGVARRLVLDQLARQVGESIDVAPLTLADLAEARALALCNSVRGVRPVGLVMSPSGQALVSGRDHRRTRALQRAFSDFLSAQMVTD